MKKEGGRRGEEKPKFEIYVEKKKLVWVKKDHLEQNFNDWSTKINGQPVERERWGAKIDKLSLEEFLVVYSLFVMI